MKYVDPRDLEDLPTIVVYGDPLPFTFVPAQWAILSSKNHQEIQVFPPLGPSWWEAIE